MSSNANPHIVDANWLNTFQIVKVLGREIFSEIYLIRMKAANQELRVLRRIKKVVFNDPN